MEKGYYQTSLIKFQAGETDISYLLKNKIIIGENGYTIRRFAEKSRNNYRRFYCYLSPHPSTRFRKHNCQNIQTEYTRRLAKIEEQLANLKDMLQELTKKREILKRIRNGKDHKRDIKAKTISQIQEYSTSTKADK